MRPYVAADGRFNRIRKVAPMCPSMVYRIDLVLPWAHSSPQPKGQMDRFNRFCTADGRKSLYFAMGAPFPRSCPFPLGVLWTPSNTWFPGPTRVLKPNGISIGSAVFARLTSVTDRPSDHVTRSVTICRFYVRSTCDAA